MTAEPTRVLMVCLGNICRSPTAEGVFRHRFQQAGLGARVEFDSAGTGDWHVGHPPDHRSVATSRRLGVDLFGLRARQLQDADFSDFDWLLCADRQNLADVRARMPAHARARSLLLMDWAGLGQVEVPDPYTGGAAQFEAVWHQLDAAAGAALLNRFGHRPQALSDCRIID